MKTYWTITLLNGDEIFLTSELALVTYFEQAVVIRESPTGFGGWNEERVIPWHQITEYHESVEHE